MDLSLPSPSLGASATSFLFRFFQRFNEFSLDSNRQIKHNHGQERL